MRSSLSRVRSTYAGAAILASAALLIAFASHAQPRQAAHAAGPTAAQKFKNIKVFKTLPANRLIPAMEAFNASLGVKCNFCHVISANHTGWEKDDKPEKAMARKMVLMCFDMNKREHVLGGKTTCFMCHHGSPSPMLQPRGGEGDRG